VYAGNLGDHQDLETVIQAAKLVESEKNLRFEIYGAGMAEERLKDLAARLELGNLTFRGSVDSAAMKRVYAESDFQLITLRDREIFRGTIPSKLQASLFNGAAVLTNVAGDVAELCRRQNLGLSCEPGVAESMAEMFRRAARTTAEERRRMADNGRKFYSTQMSLSQGLDSLEAILIEASKDGKKL
jgi:glycosyltransferase involved in cell wall biosynthesis